MGGFSVAPIPCFAAKEISDFMYCINQIKQMKSCMYDYCLQVKFDNGTTEQVKGQSYFDINKQVVFNSNSEATILYDGIWYYNANHEDRIVTLYKMNKRFRPALADSMRSEVFGLGMYTEMMDSLVLKYGKAPVVVKLNNRIKFDIQFVPNSYIKRISIDFDMKSNMILKCEVEAYFSIENYEDTQHKAMQVMTCTNYKRTADPEIIDLSNYFKTGRNDRDIKLVKYSNYKLITTK